MIEEHSNPLYQFLRCAYRAVGEAHRTNPRRLSSTPARLSWAEGDRSQAIRGRLLDISRAGAAMLTKAVPPSARQGRLRLAGPEPTPWVEVEILGAERTPSGRHRIRLKFRDPCPTYFLRVAVLGPVTPDETPCLAQSAAAAAEPHDLPHPSTLS